MAPRLLKLVHAHDLHRDQIFLIAKNIDLTLKCLNYGTVISFNDPDKRGFENTVEKEENAGDQHFLLFPQCFLPH